MCHSRDHNMFVEARRRRKMRMCDALLDPVAGPLSATQGSHSGLQSRGEGKDGKGLGG